MGLVFWIADAVRDRIVYAGAKAVAEEQAKTDGLASEQLAVANDRNRQLVAEVEALRERVTSGEDLLRALSQIKKRTPELIRLVSFSTGKPGELGKDDEEEEEEGAATFQSRRRIYVRGYARSKTSLSDAFLEVTRYRNALRELDALFEEVKQRKLLEARPDKDGPAHVAEFVLEFRIAKPE